MAKRPASSNAELTGFLRKYPKTATLELLIPDMHGFLKGKRIRKADFRKAAKDGFYFCAGTTMLSALGDTITALPYTEADGDPDLLARLVPGSMSPIPWSRRAAGQALFRLYDDDGAPFFADPRTVLENALKPFEKRGLSIVMATELEFHLLDANAERPTAHTPLVPGLGRPQPGAQVYHPDDLWQVEPFLDDVYAWCDAQNIPADAAISEYGQGQFEVICVTSVTQSSPAIRRYFSNARSKRRQPDTVSPPASWRNPSPKTRATACTST